MYIYIIKKKKIKLLLMLMSIFSTEFIVSYYSGQHPKKA